MAKMPTKDVVKDGKLAPFAERFLYIIQLK
jgi:hypothetical protein